MNNPLWADSPWSESIAGSSLEFPLEQRLFHFLSLLISVCALAYLLVQWFTESKLWNLFPSLSMVAVFSLVYWHSRYRNRFVESRNASLVFVALLMIPSWFAGGGAQDPTRFLGLPFFVLSLIVLKDIPVWKTVLLWMSGITTCLLLEGWVPSLLAAPTPVSTLVRSWVVHLFSFLVLGSMLRALMRAYEHEQRRSRALLEELRLSRDEAMKAGEQALVAKKAAESALLEAEEAKEALERANDFKEKLMFLITHDLRGPLTGLMFAAELMAKRQLSPQQLQELGDTIRHQTQTLQGLLEDLLSFQYVERGEKLLTPIPFDPQDWIRQIHLSWSERAADKNIVLLLLAEATTSSWNHDRMVLQQILENLTSNAIKYSPSGSTATLSLTQTETCLVLRVTDEGPGFSEEDKRSMYGRFQKLSAKPTGGESSIGLGLSIVSDLVALCNGTITCETAAGKGTTFTVTIPELPAP